MVQPTDEKETEVSVVNPENTSQMRRGTKSQEDMTLSNQ
jgi:hypothetical protein